MEFHLFELPNFQPSGDNIRSLPADEKWLFLFTRAATMDAAELIDELHEPAFREAIGVLQMISKTPEDFQYYEDRLKFLRDEQGKLRAARQEGMQLGVEQGELIGKVQLLEELLGEEPTGRETLQHLGNDQLSVKLADLQRRIRKRQSR